MSNCCRPPIESKVETSRPKDDELTAELGSMIPEAGGYVVWINRAFGPFAAHMNALWNLVSNTFDNALYPVMFVDYLHYFPAMRLEGAWLPTHSIPCRCSLDLNEQPSP